VAEAQTRAGQAEDALTTLGKAFAFVEDTDERQWEAELYRVRGQLLLALGDEEEAKASFHKAIEVARGQQAKSWELRATVSLCRLWGEQGRREDARQRLAEIYAWSTEGFDTADLIDARMLLEELSSEPQPGRTNSVGSQCVRPVTSGFMGHGERELSGPLFTLCTSGINAYRRGSGTPPRHPNRRTQSRPSKAARVSRDVLGNKLERTAEGGLQGVRRTRFALH
jgi:hypothetical protein